MTEIRYEAAIEAAQQIARLLDDKPATPARLSKIAYTVLEAIYAAECRLAEYACGFLCPRCFRQYRIHASLRGRKVKCVTCGHRWRSPERAERN